MFTLYPFFSPAKSTSEWISRITHVKQTKIIRSTVYAVFLCRLLLQLLVVIGMCIVKRACYCHKLLIFTGGNLTIVTPGHNNLYGNNVTKRSETLTRGARKSFVDLNFLLPDSRVIAFYIYANVTVDGTALRLQIWRPVDITQARWQLVWQQQVRVTNVNDGLYTVSTFNTLNSI